MDASLMKTLMVADTSCEASSFAPEGLQSR
jgi:hypothetical protein